MLTEESGDTPSMDSKQELQVNVQQWIMRQLISVEREHKYSQSMPKQPGGGTAMHHRVRIHRPPKFRHSKYNSPTGRHHRAGIHDQIMKMCTLVSLLELEGTHLVREGS